MQGRGFRPFLNPEVQAPIIATSPAPADPAYDFKTFYAKTRERGYILDKLLAFHLEHDTPYEQIMRDLHHAYAWIPIKEHTAEAAPLADRLSATRAGRKRGPQPLAEILAIVLARLGLGAIPSTPSEEKDFT